MSADRVKETWRTAQATDPLTPYRRLYRAKVISQSSDLQSVSVRPYDASLPDMAGVPLRHGVPGIKVQTAPGCTVQIGWDDGRPDRPFAALWSSDASALRVVIPAISIELGTENAPDFAVRGTAQLTTLLSAFGTIAGALTALGKVSEAANLTATSAQLATTLSTKVRIG